MGPITVDGEFTAEQTGEQHSETVTFSDPLRNAPTSITLSTVHRVNVQDMFANEMTNWGFTLTWTAAAPGVSRLRAEASLHGVLAP